jgi:EmrB/QacA subfamily drug resistance transporter
MNLFPINDSNRKWWILAAMGGTIGVVLLDETVVGVALPSIQRELGLSVIGSHWVVNAYLLVLAGLVAAGGKMLDLVSLKVITVAGLLIFGLASMASGFADNGTWIISARAIQGIGAAVIFPASMAMITIVFPENQRGMALGVYGAIGTVFLSLGPLVGGLFTELVSWRWIFWINPPIVLVVIAIVLAAWVDPPREERRDSMDFPGLITLVAGLGLLVFGVMEAPDIGWGDPATWIFVVVGVVLLVSFVQIELHAKAPLIEVDLFRSPEFTTCNFVVFMAQYTKISVIIFGALYFQDKLGMSPLIAGLALVVAVVPEPFFALPAGRFADRAGARKPTLLGILLTVVATVWIAAAAPLSNYWIMIPALVLWGIGQPLLFVPTLRAVMNTVPVAKQGQAGGIVLTVQLLGGTIGMTVCGTLFAVTGSYWMIFLVTGVIAGITFLMAWRWIEVPKDIS